MKGKMLWIRVGFVAVLAALIAAGEAITLAPALVWGAGFPVFMIVRNCACFEIQQKASVQSGSSGFKLRKRHAGQKSERWLIRSPTVLY